MKRHANSMKKKKKKTKEIPTVLVKQKQVKDHIRHLKEFGLPS